MNIINIHPLIKKMNISEQVKYYFNKLEFYEIIEDAIIFSTPLHEVNECRENQWSFKVELKYCNTNDILAFYYAIIYTRRQYLINNNIETQMIFYTWYDPMSGNFYFSIIPQNWKKLSPNQKLPFGCTINEVNNLEIIIQNFINDPYKGRIPIHELKEVEYSEDEDTKNYVLDIYSIVL